METFEAGIELVGSEVKSCRLSKINMDEGFAQVFTHAVQRLALRSIIRRGEVTGPLGVSQQKDRPDFFHHFPLRPSYRSILRILLFFSTC